VPPHPLAPPAALLRPPPRPLCPKTCPDRHRFSFSPVKNNIADALKFAAKGTYAASPGAGEAAVYEANARLFRLAGAQVTARLALLAWLSKHSTGCIPLCALQAAQPAARRRVYCAAGIFWPLARGHVTIATLCKIHLTLGLHGVHAGG